MCLSEGENVACVHLMFLRCLVMWDQKRLNQSRWSHLSYKDQSQNSKPTQGDWSDTTHACISLCRFLPPASCLSSVLHSGTLRACIKNYIKKHALKTILDIYWTKLVFFKLLNLRGNTQLTMPQLQFKKKIFDWILIDSAIYISSEINYHSPFSINLSTVDPKPTVSTDHHLRDLIWFPKTGLFHCYMYRLMLL